MKKLFVGFVLCLLALPAWAQYAHVQTSSTRNANSTALASTTAGSLLILSVYNSGGGGRLATVTSGFVQIGSEFVSAGTYATNVFYYEGHPGGLTSVDVTWSGGDPGERGVYVSEYTGIAASSSLITFARDDQATPGTGTDAVTSGVSNVTSQPALIWGISGDYPNLATLNIGTGFTNRDVDNGVRIEDKRVTSTGNQAATFTAATAPDETTTWMVAFAEASGATREQEGFRWGVDDGNEAAHTFEAAQDTNISIADTQSRLLRSLVNATGDPATTAYTLRYQKNGSGGYTAVPVGSTTASSITNQNVAASADDAQQSGATMTINGTTIGASLDATTEYVGMRFTNITIPVGATITAATVGVVPSGTGEDEPLVTVYLQAADDCAAFTTTNNDITGRTLTTGVSWSSADLGANGSTYFSTPSLVTDFQTVVNRGGWASGNDVCVIIQGGSTATRDLTIEAQDLGPNTNPPRLSVTWTVPNEVYITTSGNITASGEATTARLTAPAGKSTSDFVTGRRWDDENGTDSIDITTDDYTEVEWLVALSATPAIADYFDFRVYAGSSALDTYTVTPRWTIPGAGGTAVSVISSVLLAQ
jgi:hypothetical protein